MDASVLMELAAENPQAEAGEGTPKDPAWWAAAAGLGDMTQELSNLHAANATYAANATCAAFHADVSAKHAASLAQWVQYLWGQIASLQNKVILGAIEREFPLLTPAQKLGWLRFREDQELECDGLLTDPDVAGLLDPVDMEEITKVIELEDWKKKTLDDMSKLRFEHKLLRRRLMPDDQAEDAGLPGKAKSLPLLLAEHVDAGDAGGKPVRKVKTLSPSSQTLSPTASPTSPASVRLPPGLEFVAENKDGLAKRVSFAPPAEMPPAPPAAAAPSGGLSPSTPVEEKLLLPRPISEVSVLSEATGITELSPSSFDEGLLEGVHVTPTVVDGVACESAEWRIGHLSTKLRGCMGRALVSSPFVAWGLEDLRLMVFPDGKEVAKGPRSRRQKELYAKKVSEGPLEGCLKLKVPDCPPPHVLEYYLKIGSTRKGPFKHNFAESTVNGCLDFGIDWLKQVDADHSLTVSVEILRAGAAASASMAAENGPRSPDEGAGASPKAE